VESLNLISIPEISISLDIENIDKKYIF
jgi:hypothetical protein